MDLGGIDGPAVPEVRYGHPRRITFLPVLRRVAPGPDPRGRTTAGCHRADELVPADPRGPSAGPARAHARFRRSPRVRVLPRRPRRRLLPESESLRGPSSVVGPDRRGPTPASGEDHLVRDRVLGVDRRCRPRRRGVAVDDPAHENPHTGRGPWRHRNDRVRVLPLPLLRARTQWLPSRFVRGGGDRNPAVRLHRTRAALDAREAPPRLRGHGTLAAIAFKAGRC